MSNTNAILINGSICLSDLVQKYKEGHSAFSRGKNGKVYFNYTEWINEEENQYGHHSSVQLNSSKEKKEAEGKTYVGNGKRSTLGGGEPIVPGANDLDIDAAPVATGNTEEKFNQGLPF